MSSRPTAPGISSVIGTRRTGWACSTTAPRPPPADAARWRPVQATCSRAILAKCMTGARWARPPRRWHIVHWSPRSWPRWPGRAPRRRGGVTQPVIRDGQLRPALARLLRRLDGWNAGQRGDADALACEESLVNACGLMLMRHATGRPAQVDSELAQVRERIADDLLAPPSLAELAAMAGLGKYQLLRRFAAAYGMPPHAWLLQQRAERARHLHPRGRHAGRGRTGQRLCRPEPHDAGLRAAVRLHAGRLAARVPRRPAAITFKTRSSARSKL